MLVFNDDKGWVVVIGPENLARMKQGDPATIPNIHNIMICYEDLSPEKLLKALGNDPRKYLTRGWQNHPDDYAEWQPVEVTRKSNG